MTALAQGIILVLVWGFIATLVMTAALFIAQNVGWSRLNLPYLVGAFFTGSRHESNVLGFMLYMLGGWLFAFLYYIVFSVAQHEPQRKVEPDRTRHVVRRERHGADRQDYRR